MHHNVNNMHRDDRNSNMLLYPPETSQSVDGCMRLGASAKSGNRYITRFRINRKGQRLAAKTHVWRDSCCPWASPKNRKYCLIQFWALITSQPVIIALYASVLGIGVSKVVLSLKMLEYAIIETSLTGLAMILRIAAAWKRYYEIKAHRTVIEVVTPWGMDEVRGRNLKEQLCLYTFVHIMLMIFIGSCVTAFYFSSENDSYKDLGWTLLSNGLTLMFCTVITTMLNARLNLNVSLIREDQLKTVIYESLLLFTDLQESKTKQRRVIVAKNIDRFTHALLETEHFFKPRYITCPSEDQPGWTLATEMEHHSLV